MIDRIRMVNFKCFEEQTVPLGHLTVLAGLNGAGKSSVMQALLLLRQSGLRADGAPDALRWRGELVDLGSFRDVLFEGATRDRVALEAVFRSGESVGVEVGVDDAGLPDVIRRTGFAGAGVAEGPFGKRTHHAAIRRPARLQERERSQRDVQASCDGRRQAPHSPSNRPARQVRGNRLHRRTPAHGDVSTLTWRSPTPA